MSSGSCCANPQLQWSQHRDGDRWADACSCASCGHAYANELYQVPLIWPGVERCVNCGGEYVQAPRSREAPKCNKCGLTAQKDKALHDTLASAHPEGSYFKGAEVARALGRHVLAVKLATAATRWGPAEDGEPARRLRIESLHSLGRTDNALDEAYDWARSTHGHGPLWLWPLIAALETDAGNLEGTVQALMYAVQADPHNGDNWSNFAELLLATGDLGRAVDAARRTLAMPDYAERGIAVIAEAADQQLKAGFPSEARTACELLGERIDTAPAVLWVLVRLDQAAGDDKSAIERLETLVALDPANGEAKALLEKLKPPKKGWLPW